MPEARELEHGHLHHRDVPTNPATGEVEDTDVGFPGPDHHIAEREWPMKGAMGALAVWRSSAASSSPGCSTRSTLPGAGVRGLAVLYEQLEPSTRDRWVGLCVGAVIGLLGIGSPTVCGSQAAGGARAHPRAPLRPAHACS